MNLLDFGNEPFGFKLLRSLQKQKPINGALHEKLFEKTFGRLISLFGTRIGCACVIS